MFLRGLGLFFLLSLGLPQARADVLDLSSGTAYRTLVSEHVKLLFPQSRELDAREFLVWAETYVTSIESRYQFHFDRQVWVYLTERRYDNAYVSPADYGQQEHMVLPFSLDLTTHWEGFDGSAYEVFVHEVTHYYQGVIARPWIHSLFGPSVPMDSILIPSWVWEGFAVYEESRWSPYKGRLKPSLVGAYLGSYRESVGKLNSWDLSPANWRWAYLGGGNYTVGSGFTNFLNDSFGGESYAQWIQRSAHLTFASDYRAAFGETFSDLFTRFDESIADRPRREKPEGQIALGDFASSRIFGLSTFGDGTTAFVASYDDKESEVVHLAADGTILGRRPWFKILRSFVEPNWSVPEDTTPSGEGHRLFFWTLSSSRDEVDHDAILGSWDIDTGRRTVLARIPDAIGATFKPDGTEAWVFRRVITPNQPMRLELHLWKAADSSLTWMRTFPEFTNVNSPRLSPDGMRIAFAAITMRGNWDIYSLDAIRPETLRIEYASPAQDLKPRWNRAGTHLYFLSDLDQRFDVKSIRIDGAEKTWVREVCTQTQAPWFVTQYDVSPDASVVHSTLEGRQYHLAQSRLPKTCRAEKTPLPPAPIHAPELATQQVKALESFRESTWPGVLVPVSYVLIPRWESNDQFAAGFYIAGEDSYKHQAWTLEGIVPNPARDWDGTLTVYSRSLFPVLMAASLTSQPGFLWSSDNFQSLGHLGYQPRYQIGILRWTYPFYSHEFGFDVSYRDSGGKQGTVGAGFSHTFATKTSSVLGYAGHRGFSLESSVSSFPRFLGSDDPVQLGRFFQRVYLPLGLINTHAVSWSFRELVITRPSGIKTGRLTGGGVSLHLRDELRAYRPQNLTTNVVIELEGFRKYAFWGNQGVWSQLDYRIPLKRLNVGRLSVADRLWFNPILKNVDVRFYTNAASFLDGEGIDKGWHSASGAKLSIGAELGSWTALAYFDAEVYRRWTDDKKLGVSFDFSTQFGF